MIFFFIELLILAILYALLWSRGTAGILTLRISSGAKKRRSVDISNKETIMPPELLKTVEVLPDLGFERLGEVQVDVPGGRPMRSRLFVSADKTVVAELAEAERVLATFTTVFSDDAVMETGFPVGENIKTPGFQSNTVTNDLESSYRFQAEQAEAFSRAHGAPRRIGNMQDYLALEAVYRQKHVARKMRRHTRIALWQVLMFAYSILALIFAVFYWLGTDLSTVDSLIAIALLLVIALIPAAIAAFFLPYIGYWGDRRDTRIVRRGK